jgi:hypothetical protein
MIFSFRDCNINILDHSVRGINNINYIYGNLFHFVKVIEKKDRISVENNQK